MVAKKTTKKTAKKTYPATKKTLPELRRMTFKELTVYMAENHAKTEASIQKLSVENQKLSAENQKLSAENRKLSAEVAENHAKTEAVIRELSADVQKTSAEIRELSRNLGRVGNDIGELTEFIVIPKIRLAMNAVGKHTFDSIQTDRIFKKVDELGQKKPITEVDVLLFGKTEIMAVETKARPTIRDVKWHLERLEILRQNEELVGIKDKPLFGAVVGAVVDSDVKVFALERGLYVVKIREEEGKLDIEKPETCRAW